MADLSIHLPDVDEDGRDYEFALPAVWLERVLADAGLRPDPSAGPGALELHVQLNGNELFLRGRLRARLLTECSRCLGDAPVAIDAPVTALLVPAGTEPAVPENEEIELEPDDVDRVPYTGSDVVLDEFVREQLVLEVPMQPLCSPDCAGIEVPAHVRPPAEEPEAADGDPRLAPLRELRNRLPTGRR